MKKGRGNEAGIEGIQCHNIFEGTTISVFKSVCVCMFLLVQDSRAWTACCSAGLWKRGVATKSGQQPRSSVQSWKTEVRLCCQCFGILQLWVTYWYNFMYLFIYLFACLLVCLFICLLFCCFVVLLVDSFIYLLIYIYIYTYMYIYIHMYIYIYTYICIYIYIHIYVYMICVCECVFSTFPKWFEWIEMSAGLQNWKNILWLNFGRYL